MKKGISHKKVQRMRNLATGNYTAKTNLQSGYSTKTIKYKEGDVWEERGKTWTIKNSIKQTVTKLDQARDHMRIPTHCPSCSIKMNKSQHKFMYRKFKHCLFCQTKAEATMREAGTYEAWKKEMIGINFQQWLYKSKEEFKDWLTKRKSKHQITESGIIEDWSGGQTDEELLADFDKYIEAEKERLANITKDIDN